MREKDEESKNDDDLKQNILNFAQNNLRWFKRSELDELFPDESVYALRQSLFSLIEDGELHYRGEKRTMEYASILLEDTEEEEVVDTELTKLILAYIEEVGVVTVPQLIEKFNVARSYIVTSLRELEEEEQIYHEGIKKSSRYVHMNYTPPKPEVKDKVKVTDNEKAKILPKSIDRLSELLLVNNAVYVTYINESKKYELRTVNGVFGGARVLFAHEDPALVVDQLSIMMKGVELESVK